MPTIAKWVGVSLAILLGLAGIAALVVHVFVAPLGELLELKTEAAIQELDDTPKAAGPSGGPRVLIFALDGVGQGHFHGALEAAETGELRALFGAATKAGEYAHAYEATDALSVLPATTLAAWSAVFTGEPVAQTGVPGNEWFAREEDHFYAPAPVSVTGKADVLRMINDDLVGQAIQAPTLFEQIEGRSHVSLLPITRGADLFTIPDPDALSELFAAFSKGVVTSETISSEVFAHVDTDAIDSVLEGIDIHGIPDLQVVYFPGVDLYTHRAKDPLESQATYLSDVAFPAMGRVLARYEREGVLEQTWVLFISDHGHTPVLDDDAHALGVDGDDEPTAVLEQAGFRIRPPQLDADIPTHQAVVAYQGAMAYIYLADRSTCAGEDATCDWTAPPRFEEDVLAAAEGLAAASAGEGEVTGGLDGALDLILTREPRGVDEDALALGVFDGGEVVALATWLERNSRPDLLDLESRIEAMSAGPHGHRVGDIVLLARTGDELAIDERYYFSKPYRSWHGSPSKSDSNVIFSIAHGSLSGAEIRKRVRAQVGASVEHTDLTPLVLSLLEPRSNSESPPG